MLQLRVGCANDFYGGGGGEVNRSTFSTDHIRQNDNVSNLECTNTANCL